MVPCYCKNKDNDVGSAIEYAVCALKVEVIVVIGHSRCSGIKALLNLKDGADDTFHFVEDWVRIGFPARKKVKAKCSQRPFEDQCGVLEKIFRTFLRQTNDRSDLPDLRIHRRIWAVRRYI
uniref:Carbonic anhydrase n=1 Tax=Aegilops tauschii TaxID=37682 RepID=M8CAA0_AEGTA